MTGKWSTGVLLHEANHRPRGLHRVTVHSWIIFLCPPTHPLAAMMAINRCNGWHVLSGRDHKDFWKFGGRCHPGLLQGAVRSHDAPSLSYAWLFPYNHWRPEQKKSLVSFPCPFLTRSSLLVYPHLTLSPCGGTPQGARLGFFVGPRWGCHPRRVSILSLCSFAYPAARSLW